MTHTVPIHAAMTLTTSLAFTGLAAASDEAPPAQPADEAVDVVEIEITETQTQADAQDLDAIDAAAPAPLEPAEPADIDTVIVDTGETLDELSENAEAADAGTQPADATDAWEVILTDDEISGADPEATAPVGGPISMDRADWPSLTVTPASGRVTHHPHFVGDVPMGEDAVSPLHAPDPVWQIQEALLGAEAENWSGHNLTDLGAQPFAGLAQFVVMPFQAVLENPWSEDTSPDMD